VTTPQITGPGRASPVPAATLDTLRAPYAGKSLTAALPGSSPLPRPSPRFREARHSLARPERRLSNDAAGFAPCYGPHRRSPLHRAFDAGLQPGLFPDQAAACYRASWQLPRPDFHRQATTSLRTRRSTVAFYITVSPPFCWAHEKGSLVPGPACASECIANSRACHSYQDRSSPQDGIPVATKRGFQFAHYANGHCPGNEGDLRSKG
jgi:hypothetical protein